MQVIIKVGDVLTETTDVLTSTANPWYVFTGTVHQFSRIFVVKSAGSRIGGTYFGPGPIYWTRRDDTKGHSTS